MDLVARSLAKLPDERPEILLQAGKLPDARVEAGRAVDLQVAATPLRPKALATLARAERAMGDLRAAWAAIEEAIRGVALVEAGEAEIRPEYVKILLALGEAGAARAAISVARARILERAARISDATVREGFLDRLRHHARTLALARELCAS
ncbi:MAG: hypothetical protein WCJ30_15125 [Deltaproteobacteria bacterium]